MDGQHLLNLIRGGNARGNGHAQTPGSQSNNFMAQGQHYHPVPGPPGGIPPSGPYGMHMPHPNQMMQHQAPPPQYAHGGATPPMMQQPMNPQPMIHQPMNQQRMCQPGPAAPQAVVVDAGGLEKKRIRDQMTASIVTAPGDAKAEGEDTEEGDIHAEYGKVLSELSSSYSLPAEDGVDNAPSMSQIATCPRGFDSTSRRLIAANEKFIGYSVRNGSLRIFCQDDGAHGLVRGKGVEISDLSFSPIDPSLVGSVTKDGHFRIWRIVLETLEGESKPGVKPELVYSHADQSTVTQAKAIAWNPLSTGLGIIHEKGVEVWSFDQQEGKQSTVLDQSLSVSSGSVAAACFGPLGKRVACVTKDAKLHVFSVETGTILTEVGLKSKADIEAGYVFWKENKSFSSGKDRLLVSVVTHKAPTYGCILQLFDTTTWTELSTLEILHGDQQIRISSVDMDSTGSFLVISYRAQEPEGHDDDNGLLVVHIRRQGKTLENATGELDIKNARFDYLMPFSCPIKHEILSTAFEIGNGPEDKKCLKIYCVHSRPVVIYEIPLQNCYQFVPDSKLVYPPTPMKEVETTDVTSMEKEVPTAGEEKAQCDSDSEQEFEVNEETCVEEVGADSKKDKRQELKAEKVMETGDIKKDKDTGDTNETQRVEESTLSQPELQNVPNKQGLMVLDDEEGEEGVEGHKAVEEHYERGVKLFMRINSMVPDLQKSEKITGMLLECRPEEIDILIDDETKLQSKVTEAYELLKMFEEHEDSNPSNSKPEAKGEPTIPIDEAQSETDDANSTDRQLSALQHALETEAPALNPKDGKSADDLAVVGVGIHPSIDASEPGDAMVENKNRGTIDDLAVVGIGIGPRAGVSETKHREDPGVVIAEDRSGSTDEKSIGVGREELGSIVNKAVSLELDKLRKQLAAETKKRELETSRQTTFLLTQIQKMMSNNRSQTQFPTAQAISTHVSTQVTSQLVPIIGRTVNDVAKRFIVPSVAHQLMGAVNRINMNPNIAVQLSKAVIPAVQQSIGAAFSANGGLAKTVSSQLETGVHAALKRSVLDAFRSDLIPSVQTATRQLFKQINSTLEQAASRKHERAEKLLQDQIVELKSLKSKIEEQIKLAKVQASELSKKQKDAKLDLSKMSFKQLSAHLTKIMESKQYSKALITAANAKNLDAVMLVCKDLNPDGLFQKHPLSQNVILSLISQLCSSLNDQTELKVLWLRHLIAGAKSSKHLPMVLKIVKTKLAQLKSGLQQKGSSVFVKLRDRFALLEYEIMAVGSA